MSEASRKKGKTEKAIRRITAEVIRLEGLRDRIEARKPKIEAKLELQKKLLKEAEAR